MKPKRQNKLTPSVLGLRGITGTEPSNPTKSMSAAAVDQKTTRAVGNKKSNIRKKTHSSGGGVSSPQSTRKPAISSLKQKSSSRRSTSVPASAPTPQVRAASAPSFLGSNVALTQSASAAGTHSNQETRLERPSASENNEWRNQGGSSDEADTLDDREGVEENRNTDNLVRDDPMEAVEQDENRRWKNGDSERSSANGLASGKMAVEQHTATYLAMTAASSDKGGGSQLAGIDYGRIAWALQIIEQHATLWGKTTLDLFPESFGESTSPVASDEVSVVNLAARRDGSLATVSVKWEDQCRFCKAVLIIERHAKLERITVLDLLQDEEQQQKRVNQHAPEKNKIEPLHIEIVSNGSYASMCQALKKIERFANEVGVAPIKVVEDLEESYAKLNRKIALDFSTTESQAESVDTFRVVVTDIFDYISCNIYGSSGCRWSGSMPVQTVGE